MLPLPLPDSSKRGISSSEEASEVLLLELLERLRAGLGDWDVLVLSSAALLSSALSECIFFLCRYSVMESFLLVGVMVSGFFSSNPRKLSVFSTVPTSCSLLAKRPRRGSVGIPIKSVRANCKA